MHTAPPSLATLPLNWQQQLRKRPGLLVIPLIFLASLLLDQRIDHGPVLCPWRLTTGLPCAGCGLTRAFVHLSHGDFRQAIAFNLLSPLIYLGLIAWWLYNGVSLALGQNPRAVPRWLSLPSLLIVLSYWLGRTVWLLAQGSVWQQMTANSPLLAAIDRLFS